MPEVIIFDWKRTLYDPENKALIEGAAEVLQYLGTTGIELYIVGKDQIGDMPEEIERLGISSLFRAIHFIRETKTMNDMGQFVAADHPELAFVVGDRVRSEIAVGNQLGATTVWVRAGKFADELPVDPIQIPDFTINTIAELPSLIDSLPD